MSPRKASDAEPPAPGPPPGPLVDRVGEMRLLLDEAGKVLATGASRAVFLVGESGIGKSRIAAELMGQALQRDVRLLPVQCVGRGAEPLLPLKEALARQLGRGPDGLRRSLANASPYLLEFVPFVGAFLGRLGEEVIGRSKLGGSGVDGLYEGLCRVLLGLSQRTGLLLAIEDLHAADPDTLYFLNYFLQKARSSRILTVGTIQQEELRSAPLSDLLDQWTRLGHRTIQVPPLPRTHVLEFIAAAGGEQVNPPTAESLYRLSGGNPFFLQESMSWLRGHSPRGLSAPVELAPETITPEALPPGIGAVIHHRLAPADDDTRAFLDAAAVTLETSQDLEPITEVLDLDERRAVALLGRAHKLRLMDEGPDGRLAFRHDLTRRAVYGELGARHRSYLHTRAGRWHEHRTQFASAAYHYERGGRTADLVRAALAAAGQAEQTGMYYSALLHYQKVRAHTDNRADSTGTVGLGARLGKAHLMVGQWRQAEDVLADLDPNDPEVRLLRAEATFVRGDFHGAAAHAVHAVAPGASTRWRGLVLLADIHLYLGDFTTAEDYARQATDGAEEHGSVTDKVRCLGILGATLLFTGSVTASKVTFRRALDLLLTIPEHDRDLTTQATLLGNLGSASEARRDWTTALHHHSEALRLRRLTFDARGLLHSLHAVARGHFGRGEPAPGNAALAEATQLAADLGEPLERAKIVHTRAELANRAGDCPTAITLAEQALAAFRECGTSYDITHVTLTLSDLHAACGHRRRSIERAAAARSEIERRNFGLLRTLYPHLTVATADRIEAALIAYACGDAFGLPWEGHPPAAVDLAAAARLPARDGWPHGATSDDTALTLLVARHLVADPDDPAAGAFLATLADQADRIPGLGPSTTAAIRRYQATGQLPDEGGRTNGALMRALPVGWATPISNPDRRRRWVLELSAATHAAAEAACAAAIGAACASWSIDGADPDLLLAVAGEEADAAVTATGADPGIIDRIRDVATGRWTPPAEGIGLDPYQTLLAVLHCIRTSPSVRDAIDHAVALGGDTDTVAALAAGLLGALSTPDQVRRDLPWHNAIQLPADADLTGTAAALARLRADAHG
jgi:ADP-ribosylglycohydrolase